MERMMLQDEPDRRPVHIRRAQGAVLIWYEFRDSTRQSAVEPPLKPKSRTIESVVPEEIVRSADMMTTARRARPKNFRRRIVDGMPAPLTAYGVETQAPGKSKQPRTGSGSDTYVMASEQHDQDKARVKARIEILHLMRPTMVMLDNLDFEAHLGAELWAAGYTQEQIRRRWNCSKNVVVKAQAVAWVWVAGCLLVSQQSRAPI